MAEIIVSACFGADMRSCWPCRHPASGATLDPYVSRWQDACAHAAGIALHVVSIGVKLEELHDHIIKHLPLKPSNILMDSTWLIHHALHMHTCVVDDSP